MPYFPKEEETVYQCPACQCWYLPGQMQCLVAHLPGTCCHEYEHPTSPPQQPTPLKDA